MTDQEILDAEKLITGMRDDLALIASTTDAEKLTALILEKLPCIVSSFHKQFFGRFKLISGPDFELEFFYLQAMLALAEMAQRDPDKSRN